MDNKRFDDMARKLAANATRRGTLKGLLGAGIASAVALATGRDADAQSVTAARCVANNKPCGKGNLPKCTTCCSGFARNLPGNKASRCECRPNGVTGNPLRPGQCCSGFVGRGRRCSTAPTLLS